MNSDAREHDSVFGKALGIAGVVALTGGVAAGSVYGAKKLYKGAKNIVNDVKEMKSLKGFKESVEEGNELANELKREAAKKAKEKRAVARENHTKQILINSPGNSTMDNPQKSLTAVGPIIHADGPTVVSQTPITMGGKTIDTRDLMPRSQKDEAERILENVQYSGAIIPSSRYASMKAKNVNYGNNVAIRKVPDSKGAYPYNDRGKKW